MSDVENCFGIVAPVAAKQRFDLGDEECPALVLMDELRGQGWSSVHARVVHSKVDAFDTALPPVPLGFGSLALATACRAFGLWLCARACCSARMFASACRRRAPASIGHPRKWVRAAHLHIDLG